MALSAEPVTTAGAALCLCIGLVPSAALANKLECYEEPATLRNMCIQPSAARVNGDVRASPLFMGGPKEVRPTSITLLVNCKTKVTTLQDRDGTNFAGGRGNETAAVRSLSQGLCEVPKPRPDPKLRQF